MTIIEITSLDHPGIALFSTLTEAQLRHRIEPEKGIFIAESPKVIRVALSAGYQPLALLCEKKHIEGDASYIIRICEEQQPDFPIYTGERELLSALTGYTLTRGVLCAMRRKPLPAAEDIPAAVIPVFRRKTRRSCASPSSLRSFRITVRCAPQ